MSTILEFFKGGIFKLIKFLLGVLPTSPFIGINQYIEELPVWGYINWFVPVGTLLKITLAWLGGIAIYYAYRTIARWAKLIG